MQNNLVSRNFQLFLEQASPCFPCIGQTPAPARLGGPAEGFLPHPVHIAQQDRKTCLY